MRRAKVLPGLATATKTLADGSRRKYFYAWRGGPMLKDEHGTPLQLGDAAVRAGVFRRHLKARTKADNRHAAFPDRQLSSHGRIHKARRAHQERLSAVSRRDRTAIRDAADRGPDGAAGARALQDLARSDRQRATPLNATKRAELKKAGKSAPIAGDRQADYAWGVLARVLSVAKDRGTIPDEPMRARRPALRSRPGRSHLAAGEHQGVRRSGSGRTAPRPGARAMDRPAAGRFNQAHLVAV
jgi:hypothetical protein